MSIAMTVALQEALARVKEAEMQVAALRDCVTRLESAVESLQNPAKRPPGFGRLTNRGTDDGPTQAD